MSREKGIDLDYFHLSYLHIKSVLSREMNVHQGLVAFLRFYSANTFQSAKVLTKAKCINLNKTFDYMNSEN